jgi:HTH-type transcriptional regulator / antitoxin HigA
LVGAVFFWGTGTKLSCLLALAPNSSRRSHNGKKASAGRAVAPIATVAAAAPTLKPKNLRRLDWFIIAPEITDRICSTFSIWYRLRHSAKFDRQVFEDDSDFRSIC